MFKLALCVLAIFVVCHAISEEDVYEKWVQYQLEFGKNYKSPAEASKRFSLFKARLEDIEQHNKLYEDGKVSYVRGLSTHSDLTAEEFNELFPKIIREDSDGDSFMSYTPKNLANLPDWVDWRLVDGVVSQAKNQFLCQSCYTFSVTGALEGFARLRANKTLVLSEQALLDCSRAFGNRGCNMGFTSKTFEYVKSYGIPTEKSYPYSGRDDGVCKPYNSVLTIGGAVKIVGSEDKLKEAVYTEGPISITIEVTPGLSEYKGGVWDDPSCGNVENHAVLCVGYGTENGIDYWLIKNSWGPNWGPDHGFFKMRRGANKCSIMSWPSYPTL